MVGGNMDMKKTEAEEMEGSEVQKAENKVEERAVIDGSMEKDRIREWLPKMR